MKYEDSLSNYIVESVGRLNMYSSESCKEGKEIVEKKVNFQLEDSSLAAGPLHNSAIFFGLFLFTPLFLAKVSLLGRRSARRYTSVQVVP